MWRIEGYYQENPEKRAPQGLGLRQLSYNNENMARDLQARDTELRKLKEKFTFEEYRAQCDPIFEKAKKDCEGIELDEDWKKLDYKKLLDDSKFDLDENSTCYGLHNYPEKQKKVEAEEKAKEAEKKANNTQEQP